MYRSNFSICTAEASTDCQYLAPLCDTTQSRATPVTLITRRWKYAESYCKFNHLAQCFVQSSRRQKCCNLIVLRRLLFNRLSVIIVVLNPFLLSRVLFMLNKVNSFTHYLWLASFFSPTAFNS